MRFSNKERNILHKIKKDLKSNSSSKDKSSRVLLKQQQRLILLYHTNKCTDYTSCYLHKTCNTTRNIWEHVLCCKNDSCQVEYCKSTKYTLKHHLNCKDVNCTICAPCREINNPLFKQVKDAVNILCTFIDE